MKWNDELERIKNDLIELTPEYKVIWNAAIEAAAIEAKRYLNSKGYKGVKTEAAIRKLKK